MADTGWLSGASSSEDTSSGSSSWSFSGYSELLLEDGTTTGSFGDSGFPSLTSQLVVGGSRSGAQKSISLPEGGSGVSAYVSAGGAADKWTLTPTQSQVVASGFGVGLQIAHLSAYYFGLVTNFSAPVPSGATIDGIEVRAKGWIGDLGGAYDIQVDHVQVKIYYTESGGASSLPPRSFLVSQAVNRASRY